MISKTVYYKDSDGNLFANPSAKRIANKSLTRVDNDIAVAQIAANNEPTPEQLALNAQAWVNAELLWVDVQLKYNASNDTSRMSFSDDVLYAYAIECRDYVQNVDGVLTIMTDKPSRL